MQEHPLIELYITVGDERQNTAIEQLLGSVNLDEVALRTLQAARVTQPVMLTLLITDDDGIREMNTQYRQQDKPTDVLSVPLLEKPLVDAPSEQLWSVPTGEETASSQETPPFVTPPDTVTNLGDIVMSWPTLAQQAKEAGHSELYELLYLLAHGVLHLVGYDDQTEAGYQAMVSIQEAVLKEIGQKA
jgi:probable rRNA maturation factor